MGAVAMVGRQLAEDGRVSEMTMVGSGATGSVDGRIDPTIEVSFRTPGEQRRWTVALRAALLVPHLFFVMILAVVASVVVAAGWVAAIFVGRLPAGIRDTLAGIVRYCTRVYAYGFLLSDEYPSFDLQRNDEATQVDFPAEQRLHRGAVLFRLVIMFPAYLVASVVTSGMFIFLVAGWLLTLILGRLPTPLWGAFASVTRYQARFYGYAAMLTSEYPKRLFGDQRAVPKHGPQPGPGEVPVPPPIGQSQPPASENRSTDWAAPNTTDARTLASPPTPPTVGESPFETALAAAVDDSASSSRGPMIRGLVITGGARVILVLALLLGIGTQLVGIVGSVGSNAALVELDEAYLDLSDDANAFGTEAQRCAFAGASPECAQAAALRLRDDVIRFRTDLARITFPSGAVAQAELVDSLALELVDVLGRLATTSNFEEYERVGFEFQQIAFDLDDAYFTLRQQLGGL